MTSENNLDGVRVTIQRAQAATPCVVTVPLGERLLDACDEAGAPISFSCRSATCGTCRVVVLEGDALLERPAGPELETLRGLGCSSSVRLACQLRVTARSGEIQLEPVGPT